ncbi:MAG: hypothetical protein ABIW32_07460 [Terrimesophilobacter sp.]
MARLRTCVTLILTVTGLLALSGCSANDSQVEKPATGSSSEAPIAVPTTKPSTPSDEGSDTPSPNLTRPGATVTMGKWASYEYTGTTQQKAVIAARLVSVDKVTAAQQALLVEQIPELSDYTIWMLQVEQTKVSGASIATESDYAAFYPVGVNKKKVQYVTMIGWNDCSSKVFSLAFDDGAPVSQCILGATKTDQPEVAGVIYAPFDSPYDAHDGNPINFLK